MTVLVTGGTGFLGRHLIRHLVRSGKKVVSLDVAPNRVTFAELEDQVTVVAGDVMETTALIDVIRDHDVEGIIHLAYYLGTGGLRNPAPSINVNCVGTTNVFEAARLCDLRRVVYMSSVAIYPFRSMLTGPTLDEDAPPNPDPFNIYGACKLFNEHTGAYYSSIYGLETIGIRPTSVFGEGRGQRRGVPGDHYMVAPEIALLGQPVVMPPDAQISDWMYVADAAEVFRLAYDIEKPSHRIYNMAGAPRETGEITAFLRQELPDADISVSEEPFMLMAMFDTERLQRDLGFTPRYTVEQGILEYLDEVRRREGIR